MHIYKFTHKESGKSYIGQTVQDPNRRRLEHISDSKHSTKTYHFHNALRKYGIDAFTFEIIAEATTLVELNNLEELFVEKFDCYQNGYNIRKAGGNKLHAEESKQRMSESQKAAHARRRAENSGVEKHSNPRSHKGKTGQWRLTDDQKKKHSDIMSEVNKKTSGGKTWRIINGKRTWLTMEASV
jgi:group I intron endonuclease